MSNDTGTTAYAARLLTLLGLDLEPIDDPGYVGEALEWATSGGAALTGRADGPPMGVAAPIATATRGALLALRTLILAGGGDAAAIPDARVLGERAAMAGLRRQAPASASGSMRLLDAADGWVAVNLVRPDDIAALPALIEDMATDDPWIALEKWSRSTPAATIADRAALLGLPVAALPPMPPTSAGNAPFRLTPLNAVSRHRPQPVVFDLSALWAGPLCAHLLGLAGARVIKVEAIDRPDGARRGPQQFYDLLHAGHESVALDFRSPDEIERLRRLLGHADIVIEGSRPRALASLGLGPADAPGATWLAITAYDRAGPWANRVGFGDDAAVAGGLVAWDGSTPMPVADAIADPLAGLHAAVAAQAALYAGAAHLIEVSLADVAASVARQTPGATAGPISRFTVLPPRARTPVARAPSLGAHTATVLREFGLAG